MLLLQVVTLESFRTLISRRGDKLKVKTYLDRRSSIFKTQYHVEAAAYGHLQVFQGFRDSMLLWHWLVEALRSHTILLRIVGPGIVPSSFLQPPLDTVSLPCSTY